MQESDVRSDDDSGEEKTRNRRARVVKVTGCGCATAGVGAIALVVLLILLLSMVASSCELTDQACAESGVEIIRAATAGDVELLEERLEKGDDPDIGDESDNTALGCAIEQEQDAGVDALLAAGADPELQNRNGLPLDRAVANNAAEITEALLTSGADPDGTGDQLPLATAADHGNLTMTRMLVDAGADPDGRDDHAPIVIAASGDEVAIVEYLIDAGADPDGYDVGNNALVAAIDGGASPAMLTVLLEGGADPQAPVLRSDDVVDAVAYLAGAPASSDSEEGSVPDLSAHSPLFRAVFAQRSDAVEALLAGGADPDAGGDLRFEGVGLTLANVTSRYGIPLGDPRADGLMYPASLLAPDDRSNVPPLVVAAMNGDGASVEALLAAGADPNQTAFDAYTPLYAAAWIGDEPIVRALLAAGADPDPLPPNMKETPIEAAHVLGHIGAVYALAEAGAVYTETTPPPP